MSPSPWPVLCSLGVSSMMVNMFGMMVLGSNVITSIISVFSVILVCSMWWRDVVRESTFQGSHTMEVCSGIMIGMLMFIGSEVMFFFSFFFGYFFTSLSPDVELGGCWPPKGVEVVSFMSVPFLNTLLLLSSGVSITSSHHYLLGGKKSKSLSWAGATIVLGLVFLMMQCVEYFEGSFTMSDSVFGSLFYVMTGFHGIHVIVGVLFIVISTIRLFKNHLSSTHHLGYEMSAWYWHFVDVVWLFLFIWLYWWGS
nr:cytochrome c oxidase subunit 3 [Penenirmus auritus]